jgi:hypothetical protein
VKTIRWLSLLALLGTVAASADIYRSTDAKGNVVYSDVPTDNSVPIIVTPPKAGRPGNPITPPKNAAGNAQANAPGDQQAAKKEGKGEMTPAEKQAERDKNCQIARERKTKYEQSHRLYKVAPNGDREYLSDAEIDQARAQAVADVQTWCGG